MPSSATTVTGAGGSQRLVVDLISTATTDNDTITVAHGYGTVLGNITNATNRLMCVFEPILAAGALSQWIRQGLDNTNFYFTRAANIASSSNANGQMRVSCFCINSLIE